MRARPGTAMRAVCCAVLAVVTSGPAEAIEVESESGPVTATLRVLPEEPRIGDAIQLELTVVAESGVELLMPEFGDALDRFAIVDFAPSESEDDEGRTVARQRYTLQAARSGVQSIPPLLIEFVDRRPGRDPAPEDADAYELLTERLEFEVASVLGSDDSLELLPPLGELGPRAAAGAPVWPWVFGLGVLLAAAAPFALRAYRTARAERLRLSAYQVARADLDALLYGPRPSADEAAIGQFYVTLSGIVRRYLEDRFGLRSPEMTTEEFLEGLARSPDLVRAHQDLLRDFLRGADLVKFAHYIPEAGDIEASIGLAERFLEETQGAQHA